MNTDVVRLIDACAPLKTLVIGDAILDEYVEGETGGLCREAPVPIVLSRVDTMRRAGRRMQPPMPPALAVR